MTRIEQAAAAVAAVRAMFADAASLATATDDEIALLLRDTAEMARLVHAQQVRLAGAVEARSDGSQEVPLCRRLGRPSVKEAVASALGIRVREASELLSMARATTPRVSLTGAEVPARYPLVAHSLDRGDLSLSQARAIVTSLEKASANADLALLAWAEGCLVDAATDAEQALAPELLMEQAGAYVAVLDPDGVLPNSERQRAMRSLRHSQLSDGTWRTVMISPPEEGSALKALLDAYTSPRAKVRFRDDQSGELCDGDAVVPGDGDALAMLGGDALVPGDGDSLVPGAAAVPVDDRSLEQKRHDVMMGIVRAQAASGDAPTAGGESPRLVFHVSLEAYEAYLGGTDHPDRTLTIEHTRVPVPIEAVDRLLCDAVVQRAVVGASGEVLELGRTQRLFSPAQRRALAAQYRGCANCAAPVSWTDAHHVLWWLRGGLTDVKNGILLCSYCHHEVHAGRLVVVGVPGCWRVVPQLRPEDARARAPRTGRSRLASPGTPPSIGQIARIAVERGAAAHAMRGASPVDAGSEPMPWEPGRARLLAADARPSLAVLLPEAPPSLDVRPPRGGRGPVETRLRAQLRDRLDAPSRDRLGERSRGRARPCAVDYRRAAPIILRT